MSAVRRVLAAFFVMIALGACDEDTPSTTASDSIFPASAEALRADCEAEGGRWGTAANKGSFVCYRDLPDANQTCSASDQCLGACLARSRTCTPFEPFFGCHEVLSKDGLRQTVCRE